MRIDMGGRVIPWYENVPIGAVNFIKEEKPVAPPVEEVQKAMEEEAYYQSKLREGSGFVNNFLGNLNPIKIAAIVAATASGNAYLIPYIAGADTALQGGSPEDILKSAATAYVTQAVGGEIAGAGGFTGASETGLSTLAGEGVASDVGATLLNEAGTTGLDSTINAIPDVLTADDLYTGQAMNDLSASYDATRLDDLINSLSNTGLSPTEINQLTNLAPETGTEIGAYTNLIDTPVIGQPYDVTPLTDPYTGEPFGEIERPLVDNYMDGFTSVSETGLATLPNEGMQTDLPGTTLLEDIGLYTDGFDAAPRYDFSPETPVLDVSPELDPTGSLATSSFGISPMQALRGLSAAKSLLGAGQEQAAAPATQFRGTRRPQGQVDYSGILSLLQMQSPQRRSLLG